MTDMYSELLIKKEPTGKDQALKVLIIALIVLTGCRVIYYPSGMGIDYCPGRGGIFYPASS